ncbi:hypothetical protein RISK_004831 [Rhodopirellula islandica]|uniref:Uncharacterized protein n=1 Tax=Rhodopirellula islandica TaxID=595434 RepID=A0A0J1B8B2_RHOIS|nr:hypothetical protein RISK_004831 [Rhodopirellula islandica]
MFFALSAVVPSLDAPSDCNEWWVTPNASCVQSNPAHVLGTDVPAQAFSVSRFVRIRMRLMQVT